jgi:prepilin-type N-terminal cleavage/methylation domain-containing protein
MSWSRLRRSRRRQHWLGFTLIELLVVIAIIAILVALLLPAIQQVREAARKSQCQDHLHNLGVAIHDYESAYKTFPFGCSHTDPGWARPRRASGFLPLLPFIEQKPLYDRMQNDYRTLNITDDNFCVPWNGGGWEPSRIDIDVLLCPSDTRSLVSRELGKCNYMFCRGDSPWDHNQWAGNGGRGLRGMFTGAGDEWGGIGQHVGRTVKVADVTDGLSNSVAMSERVQAVDGSILVMDGGTAVNVGNQMVQTNPSLCLGQINPTTRAYTGGVGRWGGIRWLDGAPAFTGHTTILGPNKGSCTQGGWDGEDGIYEPSSRHPGGVQCVMGDARVIFVSENIDTGNTTLAPVIGGRSPYGIWGAMGSIAGGDVARVP